MHRPKTATSVGLIGGFDSLVEASSMIDQFHTHKAAIRSRAKNAGRARAVEQAIHWLSWLDLLGKVPMAAATLHIVLQPRPTEGLPR